MNRISFFKAFLNDPHIAYVTPSSPSLVRKVCSDIDFSRDIHVVEYGPGTGVITKYLLEHMTPGSRITAIEMNDQFIAHLAETKDERLRVVKEDAEKVLSVAGEKKADYVISGIPFAFFSKDKGRSIVRDTREVLNPGGKFLVYQFSLLVTRYMEMEFGNSKWRFAPPHVILPVFLMSAERK